MNLMPLILLQCILVVSVMIYTEMKMGRKLGTLQLTAPNSRGVIDVYTMSHIIHGFVFYCLLSMHFPFAAVLLYSVILECTWEIFENTPFVINRYRNTMSADYQGDTLINSFSDVLFMSVGVFVAYALPVWSVVSVILFFELLSLYLVRDNLFLNVLMLIYPFESVKKWQKAA